MNGIRAVKLILIAVFCLSGLIGCSTIKEATRQVLGISTKEVEASRNNALRKDFHYSYDDAYANVMKTLKHIGSYVYMEDKGKNLIAAYFSGADTTVVGIFFVRIDAENTRVEVSSPSTYVKEFIAEKVFSGLSGTLQFEDEVSEQVEEDVKQQE